MSFLTTRRDVISNNIANSSTANYKAQDVFFQEELDKITQLSQTKDKHITRGSNSQVQYITNENKVNDDGNSVDVTEQMIELMKATQLQSFIVNAVNIQSDINNAARGS